MSEQLPERLVRHLVVGALLAGLLLLAYAVLRPFFVPVTWAIVIASATWPAFRIVRLRLHGSRGPAAFAMTVLVAAALVLPAVWLVALLRDEIGLVFSVLRARLEQGPVMLPQAMRGLPLIGSWLQDLLNQITSDPAAFRAQLTEWVGEGGEHLIAVLGDVGRNLAKLIFALVTLFFLYRDGEYLYGELRRLLGRFLGERLARYLAAIGEMTRAVMWGLVVTALAQGFVAGLGYWWAGLAAPVLLGAVTAMVALIPFGTPVAWGAVVLWLFAVGQTTEAVGLFLWGALVVSWVDNLIRPLVISNATRIPFVLVLFGVLGGLAAFGLIGLFVGPLVLTVLMAIWREWSEESLRRAMDEANAPDEPPPRRGGEDG